MFYKGLYALLSTNAGIAALLTPRNDRTSGVFSMVTPKEPTIPYIVYSQIGAEPVSSFAGNNRFQFADWQFDCVAADYPTVKKVAKSVKDLLSGFHGTLVDGSTLQQSILQDERDFMDQELQNTEFRTILRYRFSFADND